ncbi:MAG: DNA double-strand break repair nuclease NurA [Cyanobacteria bacterium SZAS TMP-1]|nr:DNA double-strand break repair nuclease NurA [Cyanobacteria bacterium SZAS TMP-1]
MLDFVKLGLLVSQLNADSLKGAQDNKSSLGEALSTFVRECQDIEAFEFKLLKNAPWILWPTARPLEPLDTMAALTPLETLVTPWTVLGVDGSQIMPSHHEVHNCYLLNCGLTRISYGLDLPPLLTSEPRLYARPEDLYPLVDRRRVYIDELFVSLERSIFELEILTERALAAKAEISARSPGAAVDILAMYDGSLIPWSVEKMNGSYPETYLQRFEACLTSLNAADIALVGYVSKSRAADFINCLRSALCPYDVSHCREHCGHLNEEDFPCSTIWPLSDRALYASVLEVGQRSMAMTSGASVVKSMSEDNAISFCYLKSEAEVARLEFPSWLFKKEALFDFALRATLTQVMKGQGYPVALAEAHHLAVIKGPEREKFFDLLGRQMVDLGIDRVQPSPKESRKRTGFV